MESAPLDRRVAVKTKSETVVHPLSHLRDEPYVVLLGEPGAGKSTALRYEAVSEDGEVMTCREVTNGTPLSRSSTAYLDALDEYRSGGDGLEAPDSAETSETMLTNDLPAQLKDKLTIVVLDVSRPQSMIEATQKRRSKS